VKLQMQCINFVHLHVYDIHIVGTGFSILVRTVFSLMISFSDIHAITLYVCILWY